MLLLQERALCCVLTDGHDECIEYFWEAILARLPHFQPEWHFGIGHVMEKLN